MSYRYWLAPQARIVALLYRREEGIGVYVQDAPHIAIIPALPALWPFRDDQGEVTSLK